MEIIHAIATVVCNAIIVSNGIVYLYIVIRNLTMNVALTIGCTSYPNWILFKTDPNPAPNKQINLENKNFKTLTALHHAAVFY
jgi:hypothetical protein